MSPAELRLWIDKHLPLLDGEFDVQVAIDAAQIASEAIRFAQQLGLETPHVKHSTYEGQSIADVDEVRIVLGQIRAALPELPLTVAQAAARLNISSRKVYQLVADGLIVATKNPIRIQPIELERYQSRSQGRSQKRHLRHLRY
jgi:excisionase family DNA binding protein